MEGIQIYLYVCMGYILRLRNFSDYEQVELAVPSADVAVLVMPGGGGGGGAAGGSTSPGGTTTANSHRQTGRGVALACPVNRERPLTAASPDSATANITMAAIVSDITRYVTL